MLINDSKMQLRGFNLRALLFSQIFAVLTVVTACTSIPEKITLSEQAMLDNPSAEVLTVVEEQMQTRLPKQIELDAYILANGRKLSEREAALALTVGVSYPARIRILEVSHIPRRNTAEKLMNEMPINKPPFRFAVIGALQTGYGLVVDEAYLNEDWVLAHEFAHVSQFEKLGPIGMMRQVLIEHAVLDGKLIPIEREAIAISEYATGTKAPDYHN